MLSEAPSRAQDHMRGRRHARRLQYIRNMPESERTPFMERVASGAPQHPCTLAQPLFLCSRKQRAKRVTVSTALLDCLGGVLGGGARHGAVMAGAER